jgi:hypothetical protein
MELMMKNLLPKWEVIIMARAKCAVCGRNVDTSKGNCVINEGIVTHKRCPIDTALTTEEQNDLKELKDAIQWVAVKYQKPLNWVLIATQIKALRDKGYSYKDQLYALKYVVEMDKTYWGYARIEKFIIHAMEHKKKQMEYENKKKEQDAKVQKNNGLKVVSKPTFLDV